MTPLSKRLLIALAISGALNLLCAGLFIGTAIARSRARAARDWSHLPSGPRNRPERGPREARRGPGPFGGILAGHHDEMVARRRAVADARRGVEAALGHEPFDPAALDQALAKLRAETATTQELVHKTLSAAARDGDAETRNKLAQGFARLGPSAL
jgi:uncharacterized membrane protein